MSTEPGKPVKLEDPKAVLNRELWAVLTPGIVLAIDGTTEAIAKAGSVIILISMLLFAVVVARTGTRKSGRTLTPAE